MAVVVLSTVWNWECPICADELLPWSEAEVCPDCWRDAPSALAELLGGKMWRLTVVRVHVGIGRLRKMR